MEIHQSSKVSKIRDMYSCYILKNQLGLHDHIFWFKEGYEQQFYLTIKHLQYRGLSGLLWVVFRYYFLGLIVPCSFYLLLKDYAHDSKNYYNAYMINPPNSPVYRSNGNTAYVFDNIRRSLIEHQGKDVLGRSNQLS